MRRSISFRLFRNAKIVWPLQITVDWNHMNGERGGSCRHGPCSQSWPWWKVGSALWITLQYHPSVPCSGRRLWLYTRWGACHFDVTQDRRDLDCLRRRS